MSTANLARSPLSIVMPTPDTQNVDPSELAKFDAIAQTWWDPNGEMKPLHQMNPLRLAYMQQDINLSGQRILDVGCGGGILSEALARAGAHVTGLDLSLKALAVAKAHAQAEQITVDYQACAIETYAAQHPDTFDAVSCLEMLEHVPDPAQIVSACAQAVKPGGWVFFSTLNRNLKAFLHAIVGAEYLLQLLPKGTHAYEKFIRPSELNAFAEAAGLHYRHMQGMRYHPFSQTFSLCTSPDINYLMSYQRIG